MMRSPSARSRRGFTAAVALVGMMVLGASSASAWTFATQSAPQKASYNGVSFGDGAGSIVRSGFAYVNTNASIKDPVSNGKGVFQDTYAYSSASVASTQTSRSETSTWKSMSQTQLYSYQGWVGAWAESKVCEDTSWQPDICSSTRNSAL